MKKKFFIILSLLLLFPASLFADNNNHDITGLEREANSLRVEYNRLGRDGDPVEREAILREIIDTCKGTEEGESAYWELADLYLNSFPEERRKEACEMLELCLKNYPDSNRAVLTKCRLIDLYDDKDPRRAELIKSLQDDNNLPNILRDSM